METTEISPKIVWASVSTSGLENKVEHFKVARTKSVSYREDRNLGRLNTKLVSISPYRNSWHEWILFEI